MRNWFMLGGEHSRELTKFTKLVKLAVTTTVMALGLLAAPTASAEPMVCLTVSYSINGSPEEYLHDDCYMGSGWEHIVGGGPHCVDDAPPVEVCYYWSTAGPQP